MAKLNHLILVGLTAFCCGCGSIVNTRIESQAPASGSIVFETPYYLPKGRVIVSGTWNNATLQWDIKITPVIEADRTHVFWADRHVNVMFDDDVTVAVDPATGLLQTVNATSTDRTVDALGGLVSAAASALTFGTGLGFSGAGGGKNGASDAEFNDITQNAFFPSFQVELTSQQIGTTAYVKSPSLTGGGLFMAKYTISMDSPTLPLNGDAKPIVQNEYHGILVRPPVPCKISITADVFNCPSPNNYTTYSTFSTPGQTVVLPDEKHNYCLKLTRFPFVGNTTKVALAGGIVQSQEQVRPSIVMGIVGIPKTLLSALCPIPLQMKTDQYNLVNMQDKTLSAEQDIKKLSSQ